LHPDSGKPYQGTIVDFNEDLGLFIDETMQDQLYDDGDDYEMSSYQVEWCKSLAEWKPLSQTDLPADVMQIAIDALRDVTIRAGQLASGDYKASGHRAEEIGVEILHTINAAIAQIEARIGEAK
jgi:hypothetical protein